METTAQVLNAIAALAWPAIAFAILWAFRPAVASIIESAKSREFSLEIGGQKLSMKEANEQQQSLIADLQSQVAELARRIEALEPGAGAPTAALPQQAPMAAAAPPAPLTSVLWVDDKPKGNSFFIDQMGKLGIRVDLALSTADGLDKFRRQRYSAVLSDMGRFEDGTDNPDAGLDLLKAVRAEDKKIPFHIYCSKRAAERYRDEALAQGATSISASPTALSAVLDLDAQKAARA